MSNSGTQASNRQNTASPEYYDDISLQNSRYLISGCMTQIQAGKNKRGSVYLAALKVATPENGQRFKTNTNELVQTGPVNLSQFLNCLGKRLCSVTGV